MASKPTLESELRRLRAWMRREAARACKRHDKSEDYVDLGMTVALYMAADRVDEALRALTGDAKDGGGR